MELQECPSDHTHRQMIIKGVCCYHHTIGGRAFWSNMIRIERNDVPNKEARKQGEERR